MHLNVCASKIGFTLAEVFSPHCADKCTNAFTLAEVLITLGIIGVVAALTLPTLIQNYKEKQIVTQLEKSYSVISNAYKLALNEYGPVSDWFTGDSTSTVNPDTGISSWSEKSINNAEILWDKFIPFLNVVSVCKSGDNSCKKYSELKYLHGTDFPQNVSKFPVVTLNDGSALVGGYVSYINACSNNNRSCVDFLVDINGIDKGPNTAGIDVFNFFLYADYVKPNREEVRPFETYCNRNSTLKFNGYGCTGWVLQNKNMDYLHCDDLSWDGKTKCK